MATINNNGTQPTEDAKTRTSTGMEDPRSEHRPLSDEKLLLAATLVDDAVRSRNMTFKEDAWATKSYRLYNHVGFKVALYISIWGHLLLALFEKPAIPQIAAPYWATMIPEILFLSYFLVRLIHNSSFESRMRFWRDPKNLVVLGTIILSVLDMICYCIWVNVASPAAALKAVRWSRPLRPLFLVNFPQGRQLRKAFRNIRRTLPDIVHVLVLFLASIAIFALLAVKLMQDRNITYPDGGSYFSDYWDSFWDLYVLVTTANNPDVMMPAYDYSNWFAIFFVIYMILNLYIFMNIVLAVVYNNYKRHLKNEVKATVYIKRKLLARAFEHIKVWKSSGYVVCKERWHKLMKLVMPKKSSAHIDLLLRVLDDDGDENIEKKEFLRVADLLNVELVEEKDELNFWQSRCGSCYMSYISGKIISWIKTKYFQAVFDLLILVNAVCIGLNQEKAEWFFLAAFTVEIILKLYAYAPKKYFTTFWNVFDFLIIILAWIITIIQESLGNKNDEVRALDFLMVLRILRLVRLAAHFERFQVVLTTIVNIGPSIATYGCVIFVIYYVYAIIGMEVFNGMIKYHGYKGLNETTIYCGNPKLNGSEFYNKRYCGNNFNSLFHAFVLLFELMVVNQWHILSEGFVLATHKAARIYFITFHLVCVVIILNIFTAFVLEVFILEYSLSKGQLETFVEKKIKELGLGLGQDPKGTTPDPKEDKKAIVDEMEQDPDHDDGSREAEETVDTADVSTTYDITQDHGLRFRLKKSSSKPVETLLQLMFEGEIDPVDIGPELQQDDDIDNMMIEEADKLTLSALV